MKQNRGIARPAAGPSLVRHVPADHRTVHPAAIRTIHDEHLGISAVLYSLRYLARKVRAEGASPEFVLLHAMLDYIVEYPDRWHHPKENLFLFAAVRAKDATARALIDELEREHEKGAELIADLQQKLLALERDQPGALEPFADAVEAYAQAQWAHIRKEEDVLMPLALRVLDARDWKRIADAFHENDNPLFGIKPKEEAARLYDKILNLAPAPIGERPRTRRPWDTRS